MTTLLRDARFGIRLLRRTPGFTAVAVLTLALGIAATTAIFSVVYGTFFAPLPYRQADRLVMVWEQQRGERRSVSPGNYVEWKRRATAFSDINAWGGGPVNIATAERPERVIAGRATPGFLGMLGYGHPLALGRDFLESEGTPGNEQVVILTHRMWRERFGSDPNVLGQQIRIDRKPYTIVGVLAAGPPDENQSQLWVPLAFTATDLNEGAHRLLVMGRLKPGLTLAQANVDLDVAARAAAFLRELGDRDAPKEIVARVLPEMEGASVSKRIQAVKRLKLLHARRELREIVEADASSSVRHAAQEALESLEDG